MNGTDLCRPIREYVLKRDGTNVVTNSACTATSGSWFSPYDGATWTAASDVDIDHMVPLKAAWIVCPPQSYNPVTYTEANTPETVRCQHLVRRQADAVRQRDQHSPAVGCH